MQPRPDGEPTEPTPPSISTPRVPPKVGAKPLPEVFESADFIVTFPKADVTSEQLAERHLGDRRRAWMIEDFTGARKFAAEHEVVIPRRDWNPVGVFPWGYQLIPVLVYHNISAEQKGRLSISARNFEAQMRYLHAQGFRAVGLREFVEFTAGRRQLPRKCVLLAFDDGYKSFAIYARPVLKQLGFGATLFVYTDYVGTGANSLSWQELRTLVHEGFSVEAHSKTHGNLRRREGESEADYEKRMQTELGHPLTLFKTNLGHTSDILAYPYGDTDDELLRHVAQHGYVVAFTVRRQANPAFVFPLKINRSQIYAEMTLEEFAKNLTVFQDEDLSAGTTSDSLGPASAEATPAQPQPPSSSAPSATWPRERIVAFHSERAETLERWGRLRQALDERLIVLTIDPSDRRAQEASKRLTARIGREVTNLVGEGRAVLGRGLLGLARQRLLAALALDPTNRTAFETLKNDVREVTFIAHTIRPGDTLASIAELYYGDRFRAEVIAETNRLSVNARLVAGRTLRIPEIPGVPILPH
jgi:peptidoglycan/xylan/chitin deacetylase (PgdA/CDA1 family)